MDVPVCEKYTLTLREAAAYQMAVDDDLLQKNPFGFQLVGVVINDTIIREAISRDEMVRMEELEQARKEVQNGDMDRPAKQSAFKVI